MFYSFLIPGWVNIFDSQPQIRPTPAAFGLWTTAGYPLCRTAWLRFLGIGKERLNRTRKRYRGIDDRTINQGNVSMNSIMKKTRSMYWSLCCSIYVDCWYYFTVCFRLPSGDLNPVSNTHFRQHCTSSDPNCFCPCFLWTHVVDSWWEHAHQVTWFVILFVMVQATLSKW